MLEVIEKLLILQERDLKIQRTKAELDYIAPNREALDAKMKATQAGLEEAKMRANKVEAGRKEVDNLIQAKEAQIDKYSNQQLQTKKNEEYQALTNEIRNCRREISDLETRELELMEEADKMSKLIAEAKVECDKLKGDVQQQIDALNEREKTFQKEYEELTSDRSVLAEAVSSIDPAAFSRYERLLKTKDRPVVGIEHSVCGGCRLKLPAQEVVSCQASERLVSCPNCGRYLYFSKEMDIAEAP